MSQKQQVINHIARKGSITPMEAFRRYGITCLAERIRDLKDGGHNIGMEWVKRGGKRYAKYSMATKKAPKGLICATGKGVNQ